MSTPESGANDPYAAVLADLRAKRDQIDQAIRTIEAVSGGLATIKPIQENQKSAPPSFADGSAPLQNQPGDFLGMSITDAAKKLLASRRQALSNTEIANAIQVGGLVMNSADPINTVGSVLTRRFHQVGDVVKVGRGVWGLKEWYPNRSFKTNGKAQSATSLTTAFEPPAEPIDDDPLETFAQREPAHL